MMLINKACMTLIPLIGVFLSGEACEEVYQLYLNVLMTGGTEQPGIDNAQDCMDGCTLEATCISTDFDNLQNKCYHHTTPVGGISASGIDHYHKRIRCRRYITGQLNEGHWAVASTKEVSLSTIMQNVTVSTAVECGNMCQGQDCCVSFGVKSVSDISVFCLLMCSRTSKYGAAKNDVQPMVGYQIFDIQANYSMLV